MKKEIPERYVTCPTCGLKYGFVNCEIRSQKESICLTCAIKREKMDKEKISR